MIQKAKRQRQRRSWCEVGKCLDIAAVFIFALLSLPNSLNDCLIAALYQVIELDRFRFISARVRGTRPMVHTIPSGKPFTTRKSRTAAHGNDKGTCREERENFRLQF